MQTKNLKVVYTSRQTKHSYISVPKIQMEGKWLEELGFSIGTLLKVEFEENSIRIRPLTAEETADQHQRELQKEFNRKSAELKKAQLDLAASYSDFPIEFSKVADSKSPYTSAPITRT